MRPLHITNKFDFDRHAPFRLSRRRGLTLIELMLALGITSMLAAATGAMLTGVAQSVETERGRRESMIRAQAIGVRLSAYVTPSLYFLDVGPDYFVVWLEDIRDGGTVHATEVRWIDFDDVTGDVRVQYIEFPPGMPQIERDIYDVVLPKSSDWWAELAVYRGLGYVGETRMCDGVAAFTTVRASPSIDDRVITCSITFDEERGGQTYASSLGIRDWQEPIL